jgi:hypothetical protein
MIRERVLYPNPLAIAAVRYQFRTSLGVFLFQALLKVFGVKWESLVHLLIVPLWVFQFHLMIIPMI